MSPGQQGEATRRAQRRRAPPPEQLAPPAPRPEGPPRRPGRRSACRPHAQAPLAQQGNTEVEAGDPAVKEMGAGGGEALRTSRQKTIKVSASQ